MTYRKCSIKGCDNRHVGLGWCQWHWRENKRTGAEPVGVAPVEPPRKPCAFEGCERDSKNGKLCVGHNQQARKGKPLTPLRRKIRADLRNERGEKMCSRCDAWKAPDNFHGRKGQRDGLSPHCRDCDALMCTLRKFNLTESRYRQMLSDQGGVCAICGGVSLNGDRLSVDHDHACCPDRGRSCGECVRGLLCMDCNRAIGIMRDSPDRLRAAANYLEKR